MNAVLFGALGIVLLWGAFGVVAGRGPAASAVVSWLAMMAALAGLEVMADAPFVAVAQLTLALVAGLAWFVVAGRTASLAPGPPAPPRPRTLAIVGTVVVVFAAASWATAPAWSHAPPPAELPEAFGRTADLGARLFGPWWLPLEVLAWTLLAVLVGAAALRTGED